MYTAPTADVKKAISKAMSFGPQISVPDLASYAYGILKTNDLDEGEKNTSYMNKQNQDFYNKNPNFKRDDRGVKFVGNQLASIVTPTNKPGQIAKKPMTPFRTQGVEEGNHPFRGVGGAFDRGDDERHDLDPTDWYIVKDGEMFSASIYPRQVQQAIAQGFSRTRAEAKSRANSQGVAEGSVDKKPYPNTWHNVDPKLGKQVDNMSPEEKVKKGYSNPSILKKKKEQGVAEGYSLKKTNVNKYMEPGDPDEYTQDINIKDTDYEIINNKTGQVVGTASWTTNDYFGPGALKITMKNGATRWLDIWEREKGNPQTAFNRFVKDPKTAKKYKEQGVAEEKIDFAKKLQKNVDKSNKAVVKTRQDIGSRIADIGAGGKEYNVKTDAAWDAAKKKVAEGSAPKEKQKTPYRDINGPEYKAAADKQKEKMAKDKESEPGKKLADKIDNKKK